MSAFPKFSGQYEHSLDDKGRLTIPARIRARLGDHFVLTITRPEPCLVMYPESTWSEFCSQLEAAPRKDAQYRSFVRHLFSHTEEISLDSQGRLLLPTRLREKAGIKRDTVLVGTLTRVEIWPVESWGSVSAPPDNMADLMAELGLY